MEKTLNKPKTQFSVMIDPNKIPQYIEIANKRYILVAESDYLALQNMIKESKNELMDSILEKEILREMPKDFDDVFVVAKNILQSKHDITPYDIKRTVKEIKSSYPNLFVDIDQYFNEIALTDLND